MIGVILAAGRGSRMQGLTETRPKAMLPVVGKPIIVRVVEQLQRAKISRIIIVISAKDTDIRPYFESTPPAGVSVQFVIQPYAGGMAHALMQVAPYIDEPFVVTACDSLYPADFYAELVQRHIEHTAPATLALMQLPPEVIPRASSVEIAGGLVTRIVEKPTLAEAPSDIGSLALYAFNPDLLVYLQRVPVSARGEMELQDAIQMMIRDSGGLGYVQTPWRWELTIPTDLWELNIWWLRQTPALNVSPDGISTVPPVFVENGVLIPPDVRLGEVVYIESGAQIGAGARLERSVVLRDGVVEAGETVCDKLVSRALKTGAFQFSGKF